MILFRETAVGETAVGEAAVGEAAVVHRITCSFSYFPLLTVLFTYFILDIYVYKGVLYQAKD